MAGTQLGRRNHLLQPDSPVTHLSIVSRVVPVAWQHSKAVVDPGTLVSADRDVWEVDRNGHVIQHIRLILQQHPQAVKGMVILLQPRPFDTVKDSIALPPWLSLRLLTHVWRKVLSEAFSMSWSPGDRQ